MVLNGENGENPEIIGHGYSNYYMGFVALSLSRIHRHQNRYKSLRDEGDMAFDSFRGYAGCESS